MNEALCKGIPLSAMQTQDTRATIHDEPRRGTQQSDLNVYHEYGPRVVAPGPSMRQQHTVQRSDISPPAVPLYLSNVSRTNRGLLQVYDAQQHLERSALHQMLAQRSFMTASEVRPQAQAPVSPIVKEEVRGASPMREMSPSKPDGINFNTTQNLGVTWNRLEERDDLVSTLNH